MHEWALAESIIAAVAGEVEAKKLKKVLRVNVRIGELQQIEPDIFRHILENVLEIYDLPLEISDVIISEHPSTLKCRVCFTEWDFRDAPVGFNEGEAIHFIPETVHFYVRCPVCGSPDFHILEGRGVWIESIEGETC